ncbi:hypothetical protein [Hydrogenimonas cancrithermarum]|uniref:Uncharacterized protein n=1 Tax=Hydrogenimonas cancrithermarum TaxID=2993563 RepID=A0ABM8FLT3_9BACT|nr:hypothetical protein [Hydrogenimonas cancrithermarum]BDY13321.1 hypothetical protein HCR_16330 [Hydrogenimonas cancrithermarum]
MSELEEARRRFDAIAKGRYAPRTLSLEEAKARLRETDPGIDVSDLLAALDEGDLKRAGTSLVWQVIAPETIAYFTPLIVELLQSAVASRSEKGSEKA